MGTFAALDVLQLISCSYNPSQFIISAERYLENGKTFLISMRSLTCNARRAL